MADVQVQNGHLRIANDLWDAWTRASLNRNALRVLMSVVRLSYGWGRKDTGEYASYKRLQRETGLGSRAVADGVSKLLDAKVITRTRSGDRRTGRPAVYAPNKDFDSWADGVLPVGWRGTTEMEAPPTTEMEAGATPPAEAPPASASGSDQETEKENQEENQKNVAAFADDSDALKLAEYLRDAIASHSPETLAGKAGGRKLQGWAKDIDLMLRRDERKAASVRLVIDQAHRSSDHFWRGNLLSGKALRKQFDRLIIKASSGSSVTHKVRMHHDEVWGHLPELTEL